VSSAVKVLHDNALYKFTFNIDIDIDRAHELWLLSGDVGC